MIAARSVHLPYPKPSAFCAQAAGQKAMSDEKPNVTDLTDNCSEAFLAEIPCGVCVVRADERLTIVLANACFFEMFGYENAAAAAADGFLGVLDRAGRTDDSEGRRALRRVLEGELTANAEARLRHRDGSLFWATARLRRTQLFGGGLICAFVDVTSQKEGEEALRIREEEYRIAVRQSGKLVLRYDFQSRNIRLTPESASLFGLETIGGLPESMIACGIVRPDSVDAFYRLFDEVNEGNAPSGGTVLRLNLDPKISAGSWYRTDYSIIYNRDGAPVQAVVSLQDVSQQHERELAYKKWEKNYAALPQGSIAYLEFDLTMNRFEQVRGGLIDSFPAGVEHTMEGIVRYFCDRFVQEDDRARLRAYAARERLLTEYFAGGDAGEAEYRHQRANGSYGWVRVSAQILPDPYSSNLRAFLLFRDIDSQKREEISVRDRLSTDELTGVLNRKAFIEQAGTVILSGDADARHAFVMVDVDHFKRINDRFGHGYGDRVLIRVAETLRAALRANDLVARLGGDEFALFLLGIAGREALMAKLEYLREQICQRVSSDVIISCSFGAACCPQDGRMFDELYFKADVALYAAKERGRNCACIFEGGMQPPDEAAE